MIARPRRQIFFIAGATILLLAAMVVLAVWLLKAGPSPSPSVTTNIDRGLSPQEIAELRALPATGEDEAVIVSELDPDNARSRNAAQRFAVTSLDPAPPFRFRGSDADRARARECLALAGLAEAGAGDKDQRAVMQVILNRVRHPAFAKSICGVVFEGSERRTGCQFTFTCDGSLSRTYPQSLWRAARHRADAMLDGAVYAPVGNATHYHTDWVYPWWSPKLDKIAQVNTHLFFRWRGQWGAPAALSARYRGGEPDPLAMRRSAAAIDRSGLDLVAADEPGEAGAEGLLDAAGQFSPAPGVHFLLVDGDRKPNVLIQRANALCKGIRTCQVYGWNDRGVVPVALPLSKDARRDLRFSYVPPRNGQSEAVFFDCRVWPGAPPGTCLPKTRTTSVPETPIATGHAASARLSSDADTRAGAPARSPSETSERRLAPSGTLREDLAEPERAAGR